MINNVTKINGEDLMKSHVDVGCGKAIFDNPKKATRRYFLEKRWAEGNRNLTVIMTNPSLANSLSSDATVEFLIEYARESSINYDALFVVNIIPIINSSTKRLKTHSRESISESVKEKMNQESIKHAISNSNTIILGWGEFGQSYFEELIEDEELKDLLITKSSSCKVFGFGKGEKFPKHPRPNNPDRYVFKVGSPLFNASSQLRSWISE